MAPTMNITVNEQWFEATLELSGLTIGTRYLVVRHVAGLPDEMARGWEALNTSEIWTDIVPQVGAESFYTLHPEGQPSTVLATSPTFTIRYDPALQADKPLWDTAQGSWPILRTVNGTWLQPLRLPVSDYDAAFGYRANVYQVVGSEYPVVASDVAVMKQGALVFLTANNTERQRFIDYVRHHRVLHLASPCVDGLQHMFFRVLGVSESVPVKRRPLLRQWQVRFQQVPKPGWYGAAGWVGRRRWAEVSAGATSWTDAAAKFGATWTDWRGNPTNVPVRSSTLSLAGTPGVEEGVW